MTEYPRVGLNGKSLTCFLKMKNRVKTSFRKDELITAVRVQKHYTKISVSLANMLMPYLFLMLCVFIAMVSCHVGIII